MIGATKRNGTRQPGIYTTGEVARLFGVSPRTVAHWHDEGTLSGYRIPGSLDRRFRTEEVRRFGLKHEMYHVVETVVILLGDHAHVGTIFEEWDAPRLWVRRRDQTVVKGRTHKPDHGPTLDVTAGSDFAVETLGSMGFTVVDRRPKGD